MTPDEKKSLWSAAFNFGVPAIAVTWFMLKFFFCWETVLVLILAYLWIFGTFMKAYEEAKKNNPD